ncbi:MAG TPA: hypothetical protein GX505_12400 [Clostridiales bacterium]|nr:hypothetical protein [Clostridiales bacterium]
MMELYCGLDCGGTKTSCVLADENGRILGKGESGPSNYLTCSKELAAHSIKESIQIAFDDANLKPCRLRCTYAASAAIEVNNGAGHIPFLMSCIDTALIYANSDAMPVWFAVARKEPAIVTISGTGAVTYAFWGQQFIKSGGWGPWFGDEGSGYDIGRKLINAASRTQDGREDKTSILQSVCRHFAIDDFNQIYNILRAGDWRSIIASAAVCINDLYQNGDQAAVEILQNASRELVLAVKTVLKRACFDRSVPLILSGGLLKDGQPLNSLVRQQLCNEDGISEIVTPQVPIAVSAAAMALYENGKENKAEEILLNYREKQW